MAMSCTAMCRIALHCTPTTTCNIPKLPAYCAALHYTILQGMASHRIASHYVALQMHCVETRCNVQSPMFRCNVATYHIQACDAASRCIALRCIATAFPQYGTSPNGIASYCTNCKSKEFPTHEIASHCNALCRRYMDALHRFALRRVADTITQRTAPRGNVTRISSRNIAICSSNALTRHDAAHLIALHQLALRTCQHNMDRRSIAPPAAALRRVAHRTRGRCIASHCIASIRNAQAMRGIACIPVRTVRTFAPSHRVASRSKANALYTGCVALPHFASHCTTLHHIATHVIAHVPNCYFNGCRVASQRIVLPSGAVQRHCPASRCTYIRTIFGQ